MTDGNKYFNIGIELENDLFQGSEGFETAIILRQLANRIEMLKMDDKDEYILQDSNGNSVGKAKVIVYNAEKHDPNYNNRRTC